MAADDRHGGAVAADDGRCLRAGRDALCNGGGAVDAAVAAALCLAVVSLGSSSAGIDLGRRRASPVTGVVGRAGGGVASLRRARVARVTKERCLRVVQKGNIVNTRSTCIFGLLNELK